MVKVKETSKNKKSPSTRKEVRVVLNRMDSRRNLSLRNRQLKINLKNLKVDKILKVHLERLPVPQISPNPSPTKRYTRRQRKVHTSRYIRKLTKGESVRPSRRSSSSSRSSQISFTPSLRSIDRRRELFVPIRPIDIRNFLNTISSPTSLPDPTTTTANPVPVISPITVPDPAITSAAAPSFDPALISTPIPTPTPSPLPIPTPSPVPIPTPVPPRRRHAAIPRRVTRHRALDVSAEELEELANNPYSCGPFTDLCNKCGAKFFSKEPKNRAGVRLTCCKDGKISIPLPRCPPELKSLFTQNSERSNEFMTNIRAANSLFAMASFKTSSPNVPVEGQGRWCFSICGQIYHHTVGPPNSQELREPVLSHYYFLDIDEVLNRRNDFMENRVRPETLELLERSLRTHNRYIRAFKTVGEILKEETDRRGHRPVDDVIIAFSRRGDMNERRRQYDLPESRDEIAGVFFGMEPPFDVDLKLYPRNIPGENEERHNELKNLHPMADPMVYPLLFPFGEDGFAIGTRHGNHRITMREFYRFRIQCRDSFSLLHNGGKLFQQYLVDAWVRVEADVLWWIRQHQDRFRYAANEAIRRAIAQNPENANRVGRAIVLPTGFPGGPRHMQRLYLDAMAVVARHGKPDLFITFTCNPNWPEIKNNLEYTQKPENRPDLVCRVFHAKLLEFLDDIINKQIYGIVQNYHYVIEFQKRGLPHAHIVVTFIPDDRILSPEQVDEIISARIPDRELQPRLYDLVARYQVHRPCGSMNPNASCMDGTRCKKFFPKDYCENTILGAGRDRRPVYKRPRDNRFVQLENCRITNTRIVPYNPYALSKFQTHINFEVVGSLHTLKYLYKYVTKGQDCITIVEDNNPDGERAENALEIDEIRNYLDCRYVSSMEAAWRLLEFKLHDRSHAVMVLPVHLPGENVIVFEETDNPEELENRLANRSKLEAWFLLNSENEDARQYTYGEIPEHFVWDNREARWRRRQQISKLIGCVVDVTPRQNRMELFYLRILLRHMRGATSFESLRTVDGIVRDTFEEACAALNLLNHTDEYDLCLSEAALMGHPRQIRRLFGLIICILNDETIAQVPLLWRKHKNSLIEDFLNRGVSRRVALISCIREIDEILQRNRGGLRCANVGIVVEEGEGEGEDERGEAEIGEEEGERDNNERYVVSSLNAEQKQIFLRIIQAVSRTTGRNIPNALYDELGDDVSREEIGASRPDEHLFFVDGPGGTGKTYLYNTLISYVSGVMNIAVVAVAWTGIAANLLIGGTTVHKSFRLPLSLNETSTVGWDVESEESEFLKRVGLILWDEAPMTHRYAVEAVDRYLREITDVGDVVLGRKCCVFGGDFRQVLPVIPLGHRASIIDASLKRLLFWDHFRILKLTINVRAAIQTTNDGEDEYRELGNKTYANWLLALGEGKLPYVSFEHLKSVPQDLIEIPPIFHSKDLKDLITFVYSEGFASENIGERAILCPTNAMVESVNDVILELLPGECKTYVSVNECKRQSEDELEIPQDILNAVNVAGLPPHELKLKVGAIVMLLRNLDVERGECNGSRMRVTKLGEHLIQCELVSGVNKGKTLWLPKIRMIARDTMVPQDVIRTQFPVRLAYAMTINKSQGQTLNKVGVYLERSCFSHGQLYVAFSRVGSPRNIRVYVEDGLKQGSFRHRGGKKFTRNVVFHVLLRDSRIPEQQPRRQIISRGDVAEQAELDEMFGANRHDEFFENIDVSQILRNYEEPVPEFEIAENREPYEDPYVDETGIDIPYEFAPHRTRGELAARVSTVDRPGTSGFGLARPSPPVEHSSSESE